MLHDDVDIPDNDTKSELQIRREAKELRRRLERNGCGRRGGYVAFVVHPFRTTREEYWMSHLVNSQRTFLHLSEKARTFDEKTAQHLIAERNYQELDQLVIEHLLGAQTGGRRR